MSTAGPGTSVTRTSIQLFRDCLRLVQHIAGKSKKGQQLRLIVRSEFRKNAAVSDPAVVDHLKSNAIRALANYMMIEASAKDGKFKEKADAFVSQEVKSISKITGKEH